MATVFTEKDLLEKQKRGESLDSLPADALLTPSAKDFLSSLGKTPAYTPARASTKRVAEEDTYKAPPLPDFEYNWKKGGDPVGNKAIQAFFNSPEIVTIKNRMVDLGRRMWQRNYVDGNGGNMTVRVGDNLALCSPTLISKGFMTPQDICMVDFDGTQVAGSRPRTSEVKTHLAIMRKTPAAKACLHAHPPHATAYAVASVPPPSCMIPEAEVFLGEIGLLPYETPGSPEMAQKIAEIASDYQSILLENHGVICWGKDIEDAYWKMENTEAACQTIWIATQLNGGKLKQISSPKVKELIELRKSLGMSDRREDWKECELCDNSEFRPGVMCDVAAPESGPSGNIPMDERDPEAEKVVQLVTDTILQKLKNG